MPDPTPETTEPTDVPGTDVVEPAATPPARPRRPKAAQTEEAVLLTVSDYLRDAAHAVPLSGLLADQPELLDAELTEEAWDQKLTEYLESER